jgi:hypothetical protein
VSGDSTYAIETGMAGVEDEPTKEFGSTHGSEIPTDEAEVVHALDREEFEDNPNQLVWHLTHGA